MTLEETIHILTDDFCEDFAADRARAAVGGGAVPHIYRLATGNVPAGLPAVKKEQVNFRAAYVLERIFFDHPECFTPYRERFFSDFPATDNESAKRHFSKIMLHLLKKQKPEAETCEKIAEACAAWTADPKTRVGVKVWAVEILLALRDEVAWLDEALPDIMEPLGRDPSPGMQVRLRRWKYGD